MVCELVAFTGNIRYLLSVFNLTPFDWSTISFAEIFLKSDSLLHEDMFGEKPRLNMMELRCNVLRLYTLHWLSFQE